MNIFILNILSWFLRLIVLESLPYHSLSVIQPVRSPWLQTSTSSTLSDLPQAALATAKANAERTSELVNSYNAIAKADFQAAKYEYDKINNDKSVPENDKIAKLRDIGAEMAFDRVNRLEYKMYDVETAGIMRNQYAADRVTAAEETVRLLEEQKLFYETKLGEQKQFYENLRAKQWYKRILDELKQHHDLSRS